MSGNAAPCNTCGLRAHPTITFIDDVGSNRMCTPCATVFLLRVTTLDITLMVSLPAQVVA